MDMFFLVLTILISLVTFVFSLTENSIVMQADAYNKIANKMKNNFPSALTPNVTFRLSSNMSGYYEYNPIDLGGSMKYGCYMTDNNGVINILKCGNGNGCYYIDDGDVERGGVCSSMVKNKNTFYACQSLSDFSVPNSPCSLAYGIGSNTVSS